MKKNRWILSWAFLCGSLPFQAAVSEAPPAAHELVHVTLEEAVQLAWRRQPELAQIQAMIEAAEARARQAGSLPNPEAVLAAQQVALDRAAPNEKEYVAGIAQGVPLSRRLSKAREAELLDREVQIRGLEVKKREIERQVHGAFATALYQEQAYGLQKEILQSAEHALAITRARVEAGDALREDLARVEIEGARARLELQRANSLHQQALLGLASAIGDSKIRILSLAGNLDAAFEVPALDALAATLSKQPEARQAEADIRARIARVELAKAERIPDVRVELLYHRLEASRANTIDVGVSIPLPLFNRNQGRLREARAEMGAAEARARVTQNELETRLRAACLELDAALANSQMFKSEILEKAGRVLAGAEARYAAGDMSLGEILPIRGDWVAIQMSYLESLRDVMQAWGTVKTFATVP